jgi:hypothetical protein
VAGVFLSTSLFSWVITYEMDGKTFDADCDPPARSLLAGLPFFVLSFGALMTMGLVMWGRRFEYVQPLTPNPNRAIIQALTHSFRSRRSPSPLRSLRSHTVPSRMGYGSHLWPP